MRYWCLWMGFSQVSATVTSYSYTFEFCNSRVGCFGELHWLLEQACTSSDENGVNANCCTGGAVDVEPRCSRFAMIFGTVMYLAHRICISLRGYFFSNICFFLQKTFLWAHIYYILFWKTYTWERQNDGEEEEGRNWERERSGESSERGRARERCLPPTGSLLQWPLQSGLCQSEAMHRPGFPQRRQEPQYLHPSLLLSWAHC